jgi:diguanylate cyclase (GGDEF)-like protein
MDEEVNGFHRGLGRQLRRLGLSPDQAPDPGRWAKLLHLVSASYRDADDGRYTLERSLEISSREMRALHDVLSHRARRDLLTGLPNRAALTELLEEALAGRRAEDRRVAVLFVDLDGFKLVNDSLGHAAGDELLVRVAERIRGAVREQNVVARLGGDEFVVVCTGIGPVDEAVGVATRVTAVLERPFRICGQDVVVGASVGIAVAEAETGTAEEVLRRADMAMYQAKVGGRSQIVIFDEEMRLLVEHRLSTENALWRGIGEEELVLHYQPVVALPQQRLTGFEALVRWQRPGHGLVYPDGFIPIAEKTRLIAAVDSWVIGAACRQAAGWHRQELSIAVNLSARDLQHDHVITAISDALHTTGLAPQRLVVELTETTLMSGNCAVSANLARIQGLGVRVAIDDFGTGYSSLSYLRDLPATILKIDQSFVSVLDNDPTAAAIVGAIITMGHALDLTVVAEGVERPGQAAVLRSLGCDLAQGYLFARPQPIADLRDRYGMDPHGTAASRNGRAPAGAPTPPG